jgi:hypothetical protein
MALKLTHKEFIERLEKEQPDIFNSIEVIGKYVNSKTLILVKDKYGVCLSSPAHLLLGCNPNIKGAVDKNQYFTNKAKEIHGELYDYSEVYYISNRVKVKIISEHGVFWQTPNDHLSRAGCPILARERTTKSAKENSTGWKYNNWEKAGLKSKDFNSFKIYIIKCYNKTEIFYKIGKTFTTIKIRYRGVVKLPYNWEVLKTIEGSAREISELESKLKKEHKKFKYIPLLKFSGANECFSQIIDFEC